MYVPIIGIKEGKWKQQTKEINCWKFPVYEVNRTAAVTQIIITGESSASCLNITGYKETSFPASVWYYLQLVQRWKRFQTAT